GEYPNYVCTMYNDEFLAIVQSTTTYPTPTNISFDSGMHPITVNSGFFTVCTNSTKPQTMHCMHPPSDNAGTGYETTGSPIPIPGDVPGGSTGWLSTTATACSTRRCCSTTSSGARLRSWARRRGRSATG